MAPANNAIIIMEGFNEMAAAGGRRIRPSERALEQQVLLLAAHQQVRQRGALERGGVAGVVAGGSPRCGVAKRAEVVVHCGSRGEQHVAPHASRCVAGCRRGGN